MIPESIYNLYMSLRNSSNTFMNHFLITKANTKGERVVIIGKFDYKLAEVPFDGNLKIGNLETFERCKEIIMSEVADGWRLTQTTSPASEKKSLSGSCNYEIVLGEEN